MRYANQEQFDDPQTRLNATGYDPAIVNEPGLLAAWNGGLHSPVQWSLSPGTVIYRFGSTRKSVQWVAGGEWWVARKEFEILMRFAQEHDISVALAARILLCVQPEWNTLDLLVRCIVRVPLEALKGLAQPSVSVPGDGLGAFELPARNDIAARRVHQLFIPGLPELAEHTKRAGIPPGLVVTQSWKIPEGASMRGLIYP